MIPHFRLLKTCVNTVENIDLSEIDALLCCPIWMPDRASALQKIESLSLNEKNVVCAALFYCANWFRELLNAFAK